MNFTELLTQGQRAREQAFLRFLSLPLMAQPILPLRSDLNGARPPGRWVEILVRPRSNGKSQSPSVFLEKIARAGHAAAFDKRVLRDVLSFLEKDKSIGRCSVNVSGQSISDRVFMRDALTLIDHYQVDPKRLCFEITETSPVTNLIVAKTFAKVMRTLGCKMALDDFGGGMSNLPLLAPRHMDYLKIDGRFVRQLDSSEDCLALVKGLVAFARTVGLLVIAECVETRAQLRAAKKLGIHFYQGFYNDGKPKPLIPALGAEVFTAGDDYIESGPADEGST